MKEESIMAKKVNNEVKSNKIVVIGTLMILAFTIFDFLVACAMVTRIRRQRKNEFAEKMSASTQRMREQAQEWADIAWEEMKKSQARKNVLRDAEERKRRNTYEESEKKMRHRLGLE